jgi:hydrogenase maturation protein HypF
MKTTAPDRTRLKACVRGAVQGVGFRPFIFRLASELGLAGWVNNSPQGVFLEVEGPRSELETFLLRLESERPPRSLIQSLEASWLDPVGYAGFEIRKSETGGARTALVLPDIATCPDCLREIFDPNNRRHRYPFTNCTNCGPRFSIIESLPYDRANTSMKQFRMCGRCQAEYDDPGDRRFHAQPNACPECGPQLELWLAGRLRSNADSTQSDKRGHQALLAAAAALRRGQIVAVKGLGGFHLMADARNDEAVRRLRERKHREEKPFAVMFPSLETVKAVCEVTLAEERLLRSSESPIVLLKRLTPDTSHLAPSLAPGNPNLGILLPYTPLHHLLLSELGFPVVATSGNLSDEPICIDEQEAVERLGDIADMFLVHNRPIVRHVDDSIVRVMLDRELVLRRARGYAPLPINITVSSSEFRVSGSKPSGADQLETQDSKLETILAVGAHLKNTIALAVGPQVFISQHIGDLETDQAYEAFRRVIADFQKLYETRPGTIVADLHPDYLSTKYARELGRDALPRVPAEQQLGPTVLSVQHHIAHVLACMAENEVEPPVLGVSWDGTGYGLDDTIWGGEFFRVTETTCERVAHLRPFRLPGGDKAVKEPRRSALGLLYELFGADTFDRRDLAPLNGIAEHELAAIKGMLERRLNSPLTSSAGRLFDAVAALTGLRQITRFEGQAAMELEFALGDASSNNCYPVPSENSVQRQSAIRLDWSPMVQAILADVTAGIAVSAISAKFHNTLAAAIVAVAQRVGQERVVLTGGCFQNRHLTERTVRRLQAAGFRPYWHQRVPPNDGGIALGQIIAALRKAR